MECAKEYMQPIAYSGNNVIKNTDSFVVKDPVFSCKELLSLRF